MTADERSELIGHLHAEHGRHFPPGHDFVLVSTADIRRRHERLHEEGQQFRAAPTETMPASENRFPTWRKADRSPESGRPLRHPRDKALLLLANASPEIMRAALTALVNRDPLPVLGALADAIEVAEAMESVRGRARTPADAEEYRRD